MFLSENRQQSPLSRNIRLAGSIVNLRHLSFSVLILFKKVLFNFTVTDGGHLLSMNEVYLNIVSSHAGWLLTARNKNMKTEKLC